MSRDLFIMFFRSNSLHLSNHSKSLKFSECGRVLSETNMCFLANGTISTDESFSYFPLTGNDPFQRWFLVSSTRGKMIPTFHPHLPTPHPLWLAWAYLNTVGIWLRLWTLEISAPEQSWWQPHYKSSVGQVGSHQEPESLSTPCRRLPVLGWGSIYPTWGSLYLESWLSTERLPFSPYRFFGCQILIGSMSETQLLVFSTWAGYFPLNVLQKKISVE